MCVPQVTFQQPAAPPPKAPPVSVPRVVDADSVESANGLVKKLNERMGAQEEQITTVLANLQAATGKITTTNNSLAELLVLGDRKTRKAAGSRAAE